MSLSTVSKKVESDKKTENAGKTNRTELSAGKAVVNESGIEIKTLYTAEDVKRSGVVDRSLPGEPPFTRGIHAEMYRKRPWTMRQYTGFANAADTNERFHYLIKNGQTGLNVARFADTVRL